MISFFKENLLNKIVKQNELISFEIYGKKEHFKVLSINSLEKTSQNDQIINFLITETLNFFIYLILKNL